MGMPNMVFGFNEKGQMWMDQGVDSRTHDTSAVPGIDGWGASPAALGNLLLAQAEEIESRYPTMNLSREMVTDSEGAGRGRGQPGSLAVKKVLQPVMASTWMVTSRHPLRGMCGGDDASPYSNRFLVGTPDEYKIELTESAQLPENAVLAYQYGGGAGVDPARPR